MSTYKKPFNTPKNVVYQDKSLLVQKFGAVNYSNDQYRTIVKRDKWVDFVNEDGKELPVVLNSYAEDSYSPTHARFIQLKQNMIVGKGLKPNLENPIVAARLAEFQAILSNIDGQGTDINDQWPLIAHNLAVHERVGVRVQKNSQKLPRFIKYYPTASFKPSETDDAIVGPDSYFTSTNWDCSRPKTRKWPKYDNRKTDEEYQFLVSKFIALTNTYYNFPKYYPCNNAIKIQHELAKFYVATIKNGFHNSGILTFYGNPVSPEETEEKQEYFQENFIGSENAGSTFLVYAMDPARKPTYDPIQSGGDHQTFYELRNQSIEDIVIAHGGHEEITGINRGGSGFSSEAAMLEESYRQFKKNQSDPIQDLGVNGIYNKIFKDAGWGDNAIYCEDAPWTDIVYAGGNGTTDAIENVNSGPMSNLASLTGRQMIQLQRIMRKHDKGQLTSEQAFILLKPFGLSEVDMKEMLSIEDENINNNDATNNA